MCHSLSHSKAVCDFMDTSLLSARRPCAAVKPGRRGPIPAKRAMQFGPSTGCDYFDDDRTTP
jgi:hypothetical protein